MNFQSLLDIGKMKMTTLVTVGSLPHNSLFISDNYIYVIVGECSNCNILVKVISELNNGHWMRTEYRHKIHKFDFFKLVSVITASQLITDNLIRKIDARILEIENSIDPYSTSDEGFEPDIEKDVEISTLRSMLKLIESEVESVNNSLSG